jgi:ABC-2 type transport system permease protein
MWDRVRHMLIKEFIQVFRDPRMRVVIVVMPVIQVMVFGYAVTTDVSHVRLGIYDLDESRSSRDLIARFDATTYFEVVRVFGHVDEIPRAIDREHVQAVLHIRHGFGADVRAGRTGTAQLIVDGTDSNTAGIILSYAHSIAGRFASDYLAAAAGAASVPVDLEARAWFNENLESRNFYVPGVIAILVMLITLMLTSMAIVREKEVGTIEQIMVTPITSLEFILGKTAPFALIGFFDVILVTVVAVYWFEVPIRGSIALLGGATTLYLLTTLGIGLLISTVSSTQQQAMMGTFFFYFPAVLLSGFMFPIANMPTLVQWVTYLNPLRYFLVIVRGIFLKGVGPSVLWPQMAVLAVMGVTILLLATSRFNKTLA